MITAPFDGHAVGELHERRLQVVEAAVGFEVLAVDVRDHRESR